MSSYAAFSCTEMLCLCLFPILHSKRNKKGLKKENTLSLGNVLNNPFCN